MLTLQAHALYKHSPRTLLLNPVLVKQNRFVSGLDTQIKASVRVSIIITEQIFVSVLCLPSHALLLPPSFLMAHRAKMCMYMYKI